ncbi:MAG: O-antigen ligase family protein [Clostridiaceae bacterium]|nr:O-antigen ligase family protein [Clostridiaceae bacterium]
MLALYIMVHERTITRHKALIPLAFFMIFMIISALRARDAEVAFLGLQNTFYVPLTTSVLTLIPFEAHRFTGFTTYFFCVFLFLIASQEDDHEWLLKISIGGAVIVASIAVLQFYKFDIIKHVFVNMKGNPLSATMGNSNFLATYLVFLIPAPICYYLQSRRNTWLVATGIIYAGLLVSTTRGAWLAAGLVFIFIVIHTLLKVFKEKNKEDIIRTLKLIIILILTFLFITIILNSFNDDIFLRIQSIPEQMGKAARLDDSAGSSRMYIWKKAFEVFLKNWAFGIGPDHLIYEEIIMPGNNAVIADKVHNIYLEIATTMGIFALISYIVFLSFFLRKWKNTTGFVYFSMILTYLIQGLFNIDVIMVLPIFWIILGFALCNMINTDFVFNRQRLEKISYGELY